MEPQLISPSKSLRDMMVDVTTVRMSREVTDLDAQKYLCVLVTGMVQVGLLADLEGTKAYKHDVKMLSKKLNDAIFKSLGKSSDKLDDATQEEASFYRCISDLDKLVNGLVLLRADDIHLINRFIELLGKNPEAVINHFNSYEGEEIV